MPLPVAAIGGALLRGVVGAGVRGAAGGVARGAAAGGVRGLLSAGRFSVADTIRGVAGNKIRDMVTGAGRKIQEDGQNSIVQVVQSPVQEGFATAVKGSGGGGGAIVPSGGGALVSRKSSIVKSGSGNNIVDQLAAIRAKLDQLVEIELAAKKSIEDQILQYVRDSEKNARSEEQKGQETGKKKSNVEKNPIVKAAKKAFGGIFDFIKEIVIDFIKYKILDWISKPENKRLIQGTIQFFMNLFKTLKTIYDIVLGPQLKLANTMRELIAGGLTKFFDFIGGVVNFFTLKWLPNIDGILDTIKNIPKIFTEMIPNAITGIIDFFTKSLFGAAEEEGDKAVSSAVGETEKTAQSKPDSSGAAVPEQPQGKGGGIGDALKGAAGAVAGAVLNPIGTIGNLIGGMFGGGNKSEEPPKLKEGGVVGPNQNNKVTVNPLEDLSGLSGVESSVAKPMKMFMNLLTMPFKLVGAAMIALVMNTVGKIPGVKMFLKPILGNIVSAFDLPSSLVNLAMGNEQVKESKQDSKKDSKDKKKDLEKSWGASTGSSQSGAGSTTPTPTPTAPTYEDYSADKEKNKGYKTGDIVKKDGKLKQFDGQGWAEYTAPTASTGQLSFDQLKTVAKGAGFSDADATKMAAIAMAESAGNPKAHNSKPPDNSYGLWQVNMIGELGPARRKQLGISKNEELFDPATNARAAKMIKDSQGWNAWTVHRTGAYKTHMPKASAGGWITGPQSGYPVSLDGGRSLSFIGHGTEWVGMKKANGGNVRSAFVIPYDTPKTRTNPSLTGNRYNQAKSGGYMLPRFASGGTVIEYITGDQSHPAYSSDHGGGNYHDHIAFKSKAERDSAIKALESKGWYVGSKNDGKHASGSYHYSNQAFDIPFYPNQARKGVTDNKAGETKLSSQLRADLESAGFAVPGGKGPGGPREQDNQTDKSGDTPTEESKPFTVSDSDIADIQKLYQLLNGQDTGSATTHGSTTGDTSAVTATGSASVASAIQPQSTPSSSLPTAQKENAVTESVLRTHGTANRSSAAVLDASTGASTQINSQTESGNSLGNTLPRDGIWSIFRTNL